MANILVVDDDELVRAALSLLLEREGYDIVEAANGVEAVERLKEHTPDLVITDVIMPKMEGLETISNIRKMGGEVKIIAISGGGRIGPEELLVLTRKFGANDTFAKPFDNREFLTSVARLLTSP